MSQGFDARIRVHGLAILLLLTLGPVPLPGAAAHPGNDGELYASGRLEGEDYEGGTATCHLRGHHQVVTDTGASGEQAAVVPGDGCRINFANLQIEEAGYVERVRFRVMTAGTVTVRFSLINTAANVLAEGTFTQSDTDGYVIHDLEVGEQMATGSRHFAFDYFVEDGPISTTVRVDYFEGSWRGPWARPQGFEAVRADDGKIRLTWEPPEPLPHQNATNYKIYRGTAEAAEAFLVEVGDVREYVDEGLPVGAVRYYRVRAVYEDGNESRLTDSARGVAEPPEPPAPPGDFAAETGSWTGEVSIRWTPPADDGDRSITEYRLYRATDGNALALHETFGAGERTFADKGEPGATYRYQLTAVNALGESERTDERSAVAKSRGPPSAPLSAATVAGPGVGEITVSWGLPFDDGGHAVETYKLYAGSAPDDLTLATETTGRSFVDAGLAAGATRHYRVSATTQAGEGTRTAAFIGRAPTVPAAPGNFNAAAGPGKGELTLTWTAPGNNGGLALTANEVHRGTTSTNLVFLRRLGDVTSFTDTDLPDDATRYYRVRAVNDVGVGSNSTTVQVTTAKPPTEPQALQAESGPGRGQVSLSWSAPSNLGRLPVTEYTVYRGPADGSLVRLGTTSGARTFLDAGLRDGAQWTYAASAANPAGEGPRSVVVTGFAPSLPDPPTGLWTSTGPGKGEVGVHWVPPANTGRVPLTGYEIHRGTSANELAFLRAVGAIDDIIDGGRPDGSTWVYAVKAVNVVGAGASSSVASGRAPATPSAPLAFNATTGPGGGEIRLTWEEPTDDGGVAITGYAVYRGLAPGPDTLLGELEGAHVEFTDRGLVAGVRYRYRVAAMNVAGIGVPTTEDSAVAAYPPGPPKDLQVEAGFHLGEVRLVWSPPADEGGIPVTNYHIHRGRAPDGLEFLVTISSLHHFEDFPPDPMDTSRYYYVVTASHEVGEGPPSNVDSSRSYPWHLLPLDGLE